MASAGHQLLQHGQAAQGLLPLSALHARILHRAAQKSAASVPRDSRPLGRAAFTKFGLSMKPTVILCRPLGRAGFTKFKLNMKPTVTLCRPLGRVNFASSG